MDSAKTAIALLKAAINDDKINMADDTDWSEVFRILKAHSLASMGYYGIEKLGISLPDEIKAQFEKTKKTDFERDVVQSCGVDYILDAFENAGVYAMPLKGYYMRSLYPETYHRTRCDVDILIKPESIDAAVAIMEEQGFPTKEESEHEIVFKRLPMMSIELHKMLLKRSSSEKLYQYYKNVWDRAVNENGRTKIYKMTDEDFYIYMIVHLAKHYKNGGTGIRSVVDIYLFNKHFKDRIDDEYIARELKKIDLFEFDSKIRQLSLYWFEDARCSSEVQFMSDFITGGSSYGNAKYVSAAKAISISDGNIAKAKMRRFFEVAFPKYKNMTFLYPALKGKPFLLPLYWVWRGIDRVFIKKKSVNTVKLNAESGGVDCLKQHFKSIGLNL